MAKIIKSPEFTGELHRFGVDYTEQYKKQIELAYREINEEPEFAYYQDDDFVFAITEDSCRHYYNKVNRGMEAIAIIDPRDNKAWWWFRDWHPQFDDLNTEVIMHATEVHSFLPAQEVVENYLRIAGVRLETVEPDDF